MLVLGLAFTLGAPTRGTAQDEPTNELRWAAPDGCLAGDELEAAVSARLGRPAFVREHAELTFDVRIDAVETGLFRGTVVLTSEAGEILGRRVLDSEEADCHSLDEALTVVLAMMLNVQREEELGPSDDDPWGVRVSATGGIVLGLLPAPGLEIAAALAVDQRATFDAGLEVALDWGSPVSVGMEQLEVWGGALRAFANPVLFLDRALELGLRLNASVGILTAQTVGFAVNRGATDLFVEARVGLRLGVRLTDAFWFQVTADAGGVPYRPTFAVREADGSSTPLFAPFPVLGAFGAGFFVRTN